ncbi:Crp/Fnr family transcriptional regulator [Tahibacter amnicola]|uniref:CRP-like protein Clp n=1 Tax=Tahibacter amnicola TaxID=2976241 RepID=A0ABY6B9B9_9GAMM|nr:Crp/Fnr family transcriptional regulator [Tahibacter amnicola]UXI66465.1 Crp/Fnr family transcriptional regulator [Tahibacter amnicola]
MNAALATPTTESAALVWPLVGNDVGFDKGLDFEQLRQRLPLTRRRLKAGQSLYRAGQKFDALYLVHAGFLRVSQVSEDGREQVLGFRMRGELLGAESIGLRAHVCDAVALDSAEVWELPYPAMLRTCAEMPELQARLTAAMAEEMRRDRQWMLVFGTLNAEQRVATFLLDLAERHAGLGYSAKSYVLRMSRMDIASFLALKHETVSRILTHLSDIGCIQVQRRDVTLLDERRLRAIACLRCA